MILLINMINLISQNTFQNALILLIRSLITPPITVPIIIIILIKVQTIPLQKKNKTDARFTYFYLFPFTKNELSSSIHHLFY